MIILIILISLLLINLALLRFSCDYPDSISEKSKNNIKISKIWSKEITASDPLLADK
jgi:hypothetical protein